MIDFEEIRKEVAIEHNNLLSKDDPILMAVTVNRKVLEHYVDILVERNMELLKAVEVAQQKGIADAKITAGDVISKAAGYVNGEVRGAIKTAFDEGIERMKAVEKKKEEVKSKPDLEMLSLGIAIGAGLTMIAFFAVRYSWI